MGRRNAERAVREFLSGEASAATSRLHSASESRGRTAGSVAPTDLVLTCGFAGGLNPDLKLGDVVFEIRNPQFEIRNELLAAGAKPAKFHCADRIAVTAAEKAQLWRQTGADAVEMESEAIHAVCQERGIPCVTVRVISDTADENMPLDFNQLAKSDLSIDYGKLAWAIARSPGKIGALLKLQKHTRLAAEQLAEVLVKVLPG